MGNMASNRAATVYSWLAAAAASSNEPITNTMLCRTACERLAVDGVSVTLMAHSAAGADSDDTPPLLQDPVATTSTASARLEELHLTVGEGPGTEAFVRAAPVLIPDLHEASSRWPGFVPAALADDVAAVFAFPLHIQAWSPGVLTAHRTTPGSLAPQALADARAFTELAVHLLRTDPAWALTGEPRPTDGLAGSRDEVHQAVGILAVQLGVGMQESLTRLRSHAFTHDMPLSEVARAVITGRLHLPDDSDTEA